MIFFSLKSDLSSVLNLFLVQFLSKMLFFFSEIRLSFSPEPSIDE